MISRMRPTLVSFETSLAASRSSSMAGISLGLSLTFPIFSTMRSSSLLISSKLAGSSSARSSATRSRSACALARSSSALLSRPKRPAKARRTAATELDASFCMVISVNIAVRRSLWPSSAAYALPLAMNSVSLS